MKNPGNKSTAGNRIFVVLAVVISLSISLVPAYSPEFGVAMDKEQYMENEDIFIFISGQPNTAVKVRILNQNGIPVYEENEEIASLGSTYVHHSGFSSSGRYTVKLLVNGEEKAEASFAVGYYDITATTTTPAAPVFATPPGLGATTTAAASSTIARLGATTTTRIFGSIKTSDIILVTAATQPIITNSMRIMDVPEVADYKETEILFENSSVKKITAFNLSSGDISILDIDPSSIAAKGVEWKKIFAVNITENKTDLDNIVLTATAGGKKVYSCQDWNFSANRCNSSWEKNKNLDLGQDYNFSIDRYFIVVGEGDDLYSFSINSGRKIFKSGEIPDFMIRFRNETNGTIDSNIEGTLFTPDSIRILNESEIRKLSEGDCEIQIDKKRGFKPGMYKIEVNTTHDGVPYSESFEFIWGVLAINIHKSIYLENETADIGIAVLNNEGRMVCDANVTLRVKDPLDVEAVMSTDNGMIKISDQCRYYGVTNLPDYYTNYTVGGSGTYIMDLTAETMDGINNLISNFTVEKEIDFDVSRYGPTRIYPLVKYYMNFTINANKDYGGEIIELIPAGFGVTPQDDLTINEINDTKILKWNKTIKNGEILSLGYEFDAPDISPYLFTLGPLSIDNFTERREWMIASDAVTSNLSCQTIACISKGTPVSCACSNISSNDAVYAYSNAGIPARRASIAEVNTTHNTTIAVIPNGSRIKYVNITVDWHVGDTAGTGLYCYWSLWNTTNWNTLSSTCQGTAADVTESFNGTAFVTSDNVARNLMIKVNYSGDSTSQDDYLYVDLISVNVTFNPPPVVETPRNYNSSLIEKSVFRVGENIMIRVNVTDGSGRLDIQNVTITLVDPTGVIRVNNATMRNVSQITNGFLYEYNYTTMPVLSSSLGQWNITVYANDTDSLIGLNFTNLTVNDTQAPQYSNLKQSPAGNPFYGSDVQANSTWTDNVQINAVLFRSNFSGTWQNYTPSVSGSEYSYIMPSSELTGGKSFGWNFIANDSSDNWNNTMPVQGFTVQKAPTETNLLLNGTDGDRTYNYSESANVTVTLNISGKWVELWTNFTGVMQLRANGTTPVENITPLNYAVGTYNITGNFSGDENYSASMESHVLTIGDTIMPQLLNSSINKTAISLNEIICLNASATDNLNVSSVWAEIDVPSPGVDENISLLNTGLGCDISNADDIYSAEYQSAYIGKYNWTRAFANDTSGNLNITYPGLNWSISGTASMTVGMERPVTNLRINESGENNKYNQTCNVSCNSGGGSCDNVVLYAQYNPGAWADITTMTTDLVNSLDNYSCGNLAGGDSCGYNFSITSGLDSGNNSWQIRCSATSNTAPPKNSSSVILTVNDLPIAGWVYPISEGQWLSGIMNLNSSNSTDSDGSIVSYLFELDDNNLFSSPSTLCSTSDSNCTFNTSLQTRCLQNDNVNCFLRINVTDNDGAGNSSTRRIGIDNTGAISTLDMPRNSENISADTYTVNATVSDSGIGIISVVMFEYRKSPSDSWAGACTDSDGSAPYSCTWDISGISDTSTYELRVRANDTLGNLGNYDTHTGITIDRQKPAIILDYPADGFSTTQTAINFSFMATDNVATLLNCSLYVDSILNKTNSSSLNNTITNFTITGILQGLHNWSVNCSDYSRNSNISETRNFTVDYTNPSWNSQNQTINGDYATVIHREETLNLISNWTDNIALGWAWLSTNESGVWENKSGIYNSPQSISGTNNQSSFPWSNSTIALGTNISWRIYANDTTGNINFTNIWNFTIWGWSEINESNLNPSMVTPGETTTMSCRIRDNTTLDPVENYTVYFYNSTSLLGINLTNAGGWAYWSFMDNSTGLEGIICNITDNATMYYNASENNQAEWVLSTETETKRKRFYLIDTAVGSPCPATDRKLSRSAPTGGNSTQWSGEFDSGFPGTTDAGQWNAGTASIDNLTSAVEIANPGSATRDPASFGSGWLYDANLTGFTLYSGNWSFNLSIHWGQGTAGDSNRYMARISIVTCSAGSLNLVRNLTSTRITGESSHTGGQEGWMDSDVAFTQVDAGGRQVVDFNITAPENHTFNGDEKIFIELGFNDANDPTDRTPGLEYNILQTFVITPEIIDTTSPGYSDTGESSVVFRRGGSISLYSYWMDNYRLAYAVLSTNESGIWENKSGIYNSPYNFNFANESWSNFTWQKDSIKLGTNIGWRIYANDTAGNFNLTNVMNFTIWGYANTSTNLSTNSVLKGDSINISCFVRDTYNQSGIDNYPISVYSDSILIDGGSSSDGWFNTTYTFQSNGTKRISCNITDNATLYYNATENSYSILNVNDSYSVNLTISNSSNNAFENSTIDIYDSDGNSIGSGNSTISKNLAVGQRYDLKLSIPVNGTECLVAIIRKLNISNNLTIQAQVIKEYNGSLPSTVSNITPLFALNDTELTYNLTELYIPKEGINTVYIMHCTNWNFSSADCSEWEINSTADYNAQENSTHIWFNVTNFDSFGGGQGNPLPNITGIRIYNVTGSAIPKTDMSDLIASGLNSTFNLTVKKSQLYRFEFEVRNDGLAIWNIDSGSIIYHNLLNSGWIINYTNDTWYNVSNVVYAGGNWSDGKVAWNTSLGGSLGIGAIGRFYYIANITPADSELRQVYFLANYTTANSGSYDYSVLNITKIGYLEVDIIKPIENQKVRQNRTFIVNATVVCREGECGNVNGTVRYNQSSPLPDTAVNTTLGDKPFYINDSINTKNCQNNPLRNNNLCSLTWFVNATEDVNPFYEIDIQFNSDISDANDTEDRTIEIIPGILIMSLSWSATNFGVVNPVSTENPALLNEEVGYNITIDENSDPVDFLWIMGTDLAPQNVTGFGPIEYGIGAGNISWNDDEDVYASTNTKRLTNEYSLMRTNVLPEAVIPTYYWIDLPPGQYAQTYNGMLYIMGNSSV